MKLPNIIKKIFAVNRIVELEKFSESTDDLFILFIIGFWPNNSSQENMKLMEMVFLLREFYNLKGWPELTILTNFQIISKKYMNNKNNMEYSCIEKINELPEITNEFTSVFLNENNNLDITDIKTFILDFNNFLYHENVTNYRLIPIDN